MIDPPRPTSPPPPPPAPRDLTPPLLCWFCDERATRLGHGFAVCDAHVGRPSLHAR